MSLSSSDDDVMIHEIVAYAEGLLFMHVGEMIHHHDHIMEDRTYVFIDGVLKMRRLF